jgi:hypothetical protein
MVLLLVIKTVQVREESFLSRLHRICDDEMECAY